MASPTLFTCFEKFGNVGEIKETWKVQDTEQLLNSIYDDLKNWKQLCCPWCFAVMQKKEFKIHYLQNHKDNIMLVNTCDMIKSNHRAFVSLIFFIILCLEDKIQISFSEEVNKLKQQIEKLECEKEICSKTPGYENLKKNYDILYQKYQARNRSWHDEVVTLQKQLKDMQSQNKVKMDEELKNTQSQKEMKMKEKEIITLKEQLKKCRKWEEELKDVQSQSEKKAKEFERKYKEEKIKIAGLTRKVSALETEKDELKQDLNNAEKFFNELNGMNDELKTTNERLSAQREKDLGYVKWVYRANSDLKTEIANGEELFMVVDEMNDELNIRNEDLQDFIDCNELRKYSEGELEETETATGEFFKVLDDMMDEKDKKLKQATTREKNLKKRYEKLKNK